METQSSRCTRLLQLCMASAGERSSRCMPTAALQDHKLVHSTFTLQSLKAGAHRPASMKAILRSALSCILSLRNEPCAVMSKHSLLSSDVQQYSMSRSEVLSHGCRNVLHGTRSTKQGTWPVEKPSPGCNLLLLYIIVPGEGADAGVYRRRGFATSSVTCMTVCDLAPGSFIRPSASSDEAASDPLSAASSCFESDSMA